MLFLFCSPWWYSCLLTTSPQAFIHKSTFFLTDDILLIFNRWWWWGNWYSVYVCPLLLVLFWHSVMILLVLFPALRYLPTVVMTLLAIRWWTEIIPGTWPYSPCSDVVVLLAMMMPVLRYWRCHSLMMLIPMIPEIVDDDCCYSVMMTWRVIGWFHYDFPFLFWWSGDGIVHCDMWYYSTCWWFDVEITPFDIGSDVIPSQWYPLNLLLLTCCWYWHCWWKVMPVYWYC